MTSTTLNPRLLHPAILQQCYTQPTAVAVEHGPASITYGDLGLRASRLARVLQEHGVAQGERVCLLTKRSISMITAIFGIHMAGGSYIPLDGKITPTSTILHIVEDCRPSLLLCNLEFAEMLTDDIQSQVRILTIEDSELGDHSLQPSNDPGEAHPNDEAYVIYTSGTTGKPKGVSISHGNVTNLVCQSPGNLGIQTGDRVSQLMNIAFDMCAWEIFACLCNGGTLCLRGSNETEWRTLLGSVTVVISTPSILARYKASDFPNIKKVATAGEPCPENLAASWSVNAQFYNSCGPTETTIVNTMCAYSPGGPLTVGPPTPNNMVYVLDDQRNPLPQGTVGRVWAGGMGISAGYVNRPELNLAKFVVDPFANDGGKMFDTGDTGRLTPEGHLEVFGRADEQVKIKGFRVEPDGVARSLESCSGVHQAIVIAQNGQLYAYVTPKMVAEDEVVNELRRYQPYYAIPTSVTAMPLLPLTRNGKVDKCALARLLSKEAVPEVLVAIPNTPNKSPSWNPLIRSIYDILPILVSIAVVAVAGVLEV